MEFRILGPLEVHEERGALALGPVKPRAVLAALLLHPNEPVTAGRLALSLWGEKAPAGATRTVQVYVSRLRKALGDAEAIATTPAGYRLRVRPGELDAERFERGVEAGRRALAAGEPERAGALLRDALALWRGLPLADLEFVPFAQVEIARLQEQRLAALEARVDADLAMGRHAALIGELHRLLAEHPARERFAAHLMLALYRSGRQAEALEVYRDARRGLVEQVGVEPGPELQRLHHAVLNQDASLELPASAGEVLAPHRAEAARGFADQPQGQTGASDKARRSAVPRPPNRTVGRAREVDAVAERLRAEHVRLLTLTGPGGVGKTRLAVEAASAVEADFADGAGFVPLAAVGHAEDVADAIMGALAIIPLVGESPADAVERFLAVKHLLLVIDNCEHLPDATPWIGALVAACPDLTILATSREPLCVQAERTHPVPPLALPGAETHPAALADVAAVGLFCERARAHDAGFRLNDGNAAAVGEICRRVDGLPLAIELAAARCGLLSPEELAERLDAAMGAPGAAPRDAPARQQTLRATIDWSHALLTAEERDCFARFAVFSGGATVEAAEAITGAGIETLDRLVAKSLLLRRHADGRTRLRMLETIRAYAAERFAAISDCDSVRERHFCYFRSVARRHGPDSALDGPNRREHLAVLDSETENLRAALQWAFEKDAMGQALEMSAELIDYWMRRNRFAEALRWVEPALLKSDATANPTVRARVLCRVCWPLGAVGRTAEWPALLSEAETIARTLSEPLTLAVVLYQRAALMRFDEPEGAAGSADEALAYATASQDSWTIAMATWARATTARSADELRDRVDEAASVLERVGNAFHLATLFHIAAGSSLRLRWDDDARVYLKRAVPLIRQLDQPYQWMLLRGNIGVAAILAGDIEAARDAFREELTLARELVVAPAASHALTGLAAVAAVNNELERAARFAGAAAAHRYRDTDDAAGASRLDAAILEPARTRLGAEAWAAALSEGAALRLDEVIGCALDEPPQQARSSSSNPPAQAGQAR